MRNSGQNVGTARRCWNHHIFPHNKRRILLRQNPAHYSSSATTAIEGNSDNDGLITPRALCSLNDPPISHWISHPTHGYTSGRRIEYLTVIIPIGKERIVRVFLSPYCQIMPLDGQVDGSRDGYGVHSVGSGNIFHASNFRISPSLGVTSHCLCHVGLVRMIHFR